MKITFEFLEKRKIEKAEKKEKEMHEANERFFWDNFLQRFDEHFADLTEDALRKKIKDLRPGFHLSADGGGKRTEAQAPAQEPEGAGGAE